MEKWHCECHAQLTCEVEAETAYDARIEAAKRFSREHKLSIGEQSIFAMLQSPKVDISDDSEDSPSE